VNREELHRYVRGILGQPEPYHFAHSMITTLEAALEEAWADGWHTYDLTENPWRKSD
jgi:hypothetical protein